MSQIVFIEFREDGELSVASSVVLGAEDGTFGIKRQDTGEVIISDGTAVDNPSTGVYQYEFEPELGVLYFVSWKIVSNSGDNPTFITQSIGPFTAPGSDIQTIADYRGTFEQRSTTTLKLKITNFQGDSVDPEEITLQIFDDNNTAVLDNDVIPEKIVSGFFIYDWKIGFAQTIGPYTVIWSYTLDGEEFINSQGIIVVADGENPEANTPYSQRVSDFRISLDYHLGCTQTIPVIDEQGIICDDMRTVRFNFPRWNQNLGVRVYRNQKIVTNGLTINYFKGEVIFDDTLHEKYDTVNANYNFRWFKDEELDRFLSNGLHKFNSYPPMSNSTTIENIQERFIPHILYGAAVDALRNLILCLTLQEPKEVFGGMEQAKEAQKVMESLKQDYEKDLKDLLEQKKNFPYKGLTKVISVPEFTLPGGRSRWFRYLMGGFNLT